MKKLPVVISIPHGGMEIPAELKDSVCIEKRELFDDIDPFTHDIYNLAKKVKEVIKTDIARTFVDLNRPPDDLPEKNPDGVIKSMTCFQRPIYFSGKEPTSKVINQLLKTYYLPYHQRLKKVNQKDDVELVLDCHSMVATGPVISPDPGSKRPLICLGNVRGNSSPDHVVEKLAAGFKSAFGLKDSEVTINKPFSGGYIVKTYGRKPLPWVQVELNRNFYLADPWFDPDQLTVDKKRLRELNQMFYAAIERYFA